MSTIPEKVLILIKAAFSLFDFLSERRRRRRSDKLNETQKDEKK